MPRLVKFRPEHILVASKVLERNTHSFETHLFKSGSEHNHGESPRDYRVNITTIAWMLRQGTDMPAPIKPVQSQSFQTELNEATLLKDCFLARQF